MNKLYNIFIFLSTFIRNILEVYSCIYLYQKGLSFREILLFYILVYLIGIILNIMIMLFWVMKGFILIGF